MKINTKEVIESVEFTLEEAKAVIKLIGVHNNTKRMAHGLTLEQSTLLQDIYWNEGVKDIR